jgi:hypothetical protein
MGAPDASGINQSTFRHWQREGLLTPPGKVFTCEWTCDGESSGSISVVVRDVASRWAIGWARAVNRSSSPLASIQTVVRASEYKEIFAGLMGHPDYDRPYTFLFFNIIQGLVRKLDDLKIDDQVEFYFDTMGNESKDRILAAFREFIAEGPIELTARIAGEPEFKDDKKPIRSRPPI